MAGTSADGRLVEIIELEGHPWFVGTQFHPELKSLTQPAPSIVPRLHRRHPKPAINKGQDFAPALQTYYICLCTVPSGTVGLSLPKTVAGPSSRLRGARPVKLICFLTSAKL